MTTIKLHGLPLTDNQPIGSGLFSARDSRGELRIHNGDKFIGYSRSDYRNRKQEPRFGLHCWAIRHDRPEVHRRCAWKTRTGAEHALIRIALKLNPA